MEIVNVFTIKNPTDMDYESAIDPLRRILSERRVIENGNEIQREIFEEDGSCSMKEISFYDEQKHLIKMEEYSNGFELPDEIKQFEFNESGLPISETSIFNEDIFSQKKYLYDTKSRLIEIGLEEGELIRNRTAYFYENDFENCCTREEFWENNELIREVSRKWKTVNGKKEVEEEFFDEKKESFQSRIYRYYVYGENENNVVRETYNNNGDFLEEFRQFQNAKGWIMKNEFHLTELADEVPYKSEEYEYDSNENITKMVITHNDKMEFMQKNSYDKKGKLIRQLTWNFQSLSLLEFEYEKME